MNIMGVTNHFLIGFKAYCTGKKHMLTTVNLAKNFKILKAPGQTYRYYFSKWI